MNLFSLLPVMTIYARNNSLPSQINSKKRRNTFFNGKNEARLWVVHFSDQNTCSFRQVETEVSHWKYKQSFYFGRYFLAICAGSWRSTRHFNLKFIRASRNTNTTVFCTWNFWILKKINFRMENLTTPILAWNTKFLEDINVRILPWLWKCLILIIFIEWKYYIQV